MYLDLDIYSGSVIKDYYAEAWVLVRKGCMGKGLEPKESKFKWSRVQLDG
jgi:hypothetical protein